MFHVTKTNWC